jgi:hypothetical protein
MESLPKIFNLLKKTKQSTDKLLTSNSHHCLNIVLSKKISSVEVFLESQKDSFLSFLLEIKEKEKFEILGNYCKHYPTFVLKEWKLLKESLKKDLNSNEGFYFIVDFIR